jgi:L-threonylcarbamoyladenylate synthase
MIDVAQAAAAQIDTAQIDTAQIDTAQIDQAARILEAGGLVAFPTETVYGLGADAENPAAVAKIYQAKGRPQDHPVIVHLAPEADPGYWVSALPDAARQLVVAFWPGPLTLILQRAHHIPDAVSGGQDTIGLRCPAHPLAQALLRAFKQGKGGLAAPSANKFGHVSPTTAQHVQQEFALDPNHLLQMVLDGGSCAVGIESTILDLSRMATHGPVLLRPGHISTEQIETVLHRSVAAADVTAPRASGTLASHYAPRTPVVLQSAARLLQSAHELQQAGCSFTVILYDMPTPPGVSAICRLPCDAKAYARQLYSALRDMDQHHTRVILVQTPPDAVKWHGVNDRLRRAAHGSEQILQQLT